MNKEKVYEDTGYQDTGYQEYLCRNCGYDKAHPMLTHIFDGEDILHNVCNKCGFANYICKLTDVLSEYRFK